MLRKTFLIFVALFVSVLSSMAADNRFTLVIDAGHGGHDSGARGAVSAEKDLTLRYALAFGRAVEAGCPDVRVIYTRRRDVFLPLHERADIANRNKADLFISIHINALDHGHISYGFQSYTLGTGQRTGTKGLKENLEVAKRENSVIFMEKDYKSNYKDLENTAEGDIMFEFIADQNRERSVELSRLMQKEVCKATGRVNGGPHQNNLAVLRLTSMPAILLELGFITTPDEEAFLNTDSALVLYTKGIYNAFVAYKKKYNDNIQVPLRDSNYDFDPSFIGKADNERRSGGNISSSSARRGRQVQESRREEAPSSSKGTTAVRQTAIDNGRPVFKIQIFANKVKVRDGSPAFKGLTGCESYEEGSYTKYTYGKSNNYNEMYRLKKSIADKFPTAIIVAFKNNQKMDINEAIREFLDNKRRK